MITVPSLVDYKEAAKILGVSDRTVWQKVKDGEIPRVSIGRSVKIDVEDLCKYIDKNKSSGPPAALVV